MPFQTEANESSLYENSGKTRPLEARLMEEFNKYLSGQILYGDDFSGEKLNAWYADEQEGYSALKEDYEEAYYYTKINEIHGFSKIRNKNRFNRVLSIGGAKGEELTPIEDLTEGIIIIEPSEKLKSECVLKGNVKYVSPRQDGKIEYLNNTFDLVTSFGALHHIPNVSFVFGEMVRVAKKGGYILVREPVVSMGDWRRPRSGLTKRERGIPELIFEKLIKGNNLEIVSKRKIMFPLLRMLRLWGMGCRSYGFFVRIDYVFSNLFAWNRRYHSTKWWHKLQPQSVFYVLIKK